MLVSGKLVLQKERSIIHAIVQLAKENFKKFFITSVPDNETMQRSTNSGGGQNLSHFLRSNLFPLLKEVVMVDGGEKLMLTICTLPMSN